MNKERIRWKEHRPKPIDHIGLGCTHVGFLGQSIGDLDRIGTARVCYLNKKGVVAESVNL